MEIERMMGCQIPAFGVWNYCNDLSITQYFDSAMQARLMKRWNRQGAVIRREVEKHCSADVLQDVTVQAEVGAYPLEHSKVVRKPVDEDLYKVPQPLLYRKPRKK
nr:unnamed protein product [Digitaria exilis]